MPARNRRLDRWTELQAAIGELHLGDETDRRELVRLKLLAMLNDQLALLRSLAEERGLSDQEVLVLSRRIDSSFGLGFVWGAASEVAAALDLDVEDEVVAGYLVEVMRSAFVEVYEASAAKLWARASALFESKDAEFEVGVRAGSEDLRRVLTLVPPPGEHSASYALAQFVLDGGSQTNMEHRAKESIDPEELLASAEDSARWPSDFDSEAAQEFFVMVVLAALGQPDRDLRPFEEAFFELAPKQRRTVALEQILTLAERSDSMPVAVAMVPFLFFEQDPQLLSTAALDLSVAAFRGENDDVTLGARMVIDAISSRQRAGDSHAAGALASGILLVGDERFLPVMHEAWDLLEDEGREVMAAARSGFATDAHAQFLLERLERPLQPALFGSLAGSLAGLARIADTHGIRRIRRVVPVCENPDQPIELLDSWNTEEYGFRIRDRLEELIANEEQDDERVMPIVLSCWCPR